MIKPILSLMKMAALYAIVILLIGCSGESVVCGDLENVHYVINHYYNNKDKVSLVEYYNSEDQLLRHWRPAIEIKNYKYDNEGKLIEIQYSRNCRSIMEYSYQLYNDQGQLIGEHISNTPITNLSSINVKQTKFYSTNGLLEREITKEKGREVEKQYSYENGRPKQIITLHINYEQTKVETNFFGPSNLIDSTQIQTNQRAWTEINLYDQDGRIVSKTLRSKSNPAISRPNYDESKVVFHNYNHVRTYTYKDNGNTTIERRLGKNGKSHLTIIKETKYKS